MRRMIQSRRHEPKRNLWIVAVLAVTILIPSIDGNIVNIGLPAISSALHASFASVQWVSLGYLLAVASLIVAIGRLGDLFGKRRIYLSGIVLFTVSSLLCGLSGSIYLLIVLRAVQGIGGAVLMAMSYAILGDLVPKKYMVSGMSVLTAMLPIGFALGPTVGGILIHFLGWKSIFFFNVPLGVAALLPALRFPDIPVSAVKEKMDVPGTLLLALTLACYVLCVTIGEDQGLSTTVLLLLALTVAGLAFFILFERRTADPLIRLSMFRSVTFSASLVLSVAIYTAISGAMVVLPFYLELGRGFSSLLAGVLITAGPLGCAVFTPVSGRLSRRLGYYKTMRLGILCFAVGAFLVSLLTVSTGAVLFAVILFLFDGSLAFFQTPNNTAIITMAQPEERGLASGLLNLSRTVGQVTGASVVGAMFYLYAHTRTLSKASPAVIASSVRSTFLIVSIVLAAGFLASLKLLKEPKDAPSGREG